MVLHTSTDGRLRSCCWELSCSTTDLTFGEWNGTVPDAGSPPDAITLGGSLEPLKSSAASSWAACLVLGRNMFILCPRARELDACLFALSTKLGVTREHFSFGPSGKQFFLLHFSLQSAAGASIVAISAGLL